MIRPWYSRVCHSGNLLAAAGRRRPARPATIGLNSSAGAWAISCGIGRTRGSAAMDFALEVPWWEVSPVSAALAFRGAVGSCGIKIHGQPPPRCFPRCFSHSCLHGTRAESILVSTPRWRRALFFWNGLTHLGILEWRQTPPSASCCGVPGTPNASRKQEPSGRGESLLELTLQRCTELLRAGEGPFEFQADVITSQ